MASHLDLEEQEQLDQIKHFWNRWGNLISGLLLVVALAYAGWNGWQWWQKRNATQASVLFDTVEQAARSGDLPLLERSLADMQSRYGSSTLAQHAGLLAARTYQAKGEVDKAKASLSWVAQESGDEGLAALALWRLAAVQMQAQDWAGAKASLSARKVPVAFQPLFDEAMGDWAQLQGLSDQARDAYLKAWQAATPLSDHRRWIEIKLAALGVEPKEKP